MSWEADALNAHTIAPQLVDVESVLEGIVDGASTTPHIVEVGRFQSATTLWLKTFDEPIDLYFLTVLDL